MRKYFYSIFVFILLAGYTTAPVVFAVGSGSGGSSPACTQSVWTCTDWSSCSTSGTQTRNCTLTFSCPTANTPEPPTTQSCTPPALPPEPSIKPACTSSTWKCTAWSASCDIYGQQQRTCTRVADCPASPTPSPATTEACGHLQCGNLPALHDRIACRLNLAPEGAVRELAIQYLPEECRAMTNATEKQECITRYKAYAPCWNLPAGEGRFACAKQVLNLGESVSDEAQRCQGKTGTDRASCEKALKEKVLYSIKFRFYDLEQRAEDLARRGADLAAVANLETAIETKKQAFDAAKTNNELMQTILDVRAAWQSFVERVKDQVK